MSTYCPCLPKRHCTSSRGLFSSDNKESGKNPTALEEEILAGSKTNIVGNIHLFNLFIPLLLKGEQKKVVFISSGHADLDLISKYEILVSGPYSLAKAATNVVVAKFHAEYAKDGVLFMSISPGFVDTGHLDTSKCKPGGYLAFISCSICIRTFKANFGLAYSDRRTTEGIGINGGAVPEICTALQGPDYPGGISQASHFGLRESQCCEWGWRFLRFPPWDQAVALIYKMGTFRMSNISIFQTRGRRKQEVLLSSKIAFVTPMFNKSVLVTNLSPLSCELLMCQPWKLT